MTSTTITEPDIETIKDLMYENEVEGIDKLMNQLSKDLEFEIIINDTKKINNPITSETFSKLMKFLLFTSKKTDAKL